MSQVLGFDSGNVFDVSGVWTCQYDGLEFRDENVYAQHMMMSHGVIVPISGFTPTVTPDMIPPSPTPAYQPPGSQDFPNIVDTTPRPIPAVPQYVSFTPVAPVYTPAPLVPTYTPMPAPQAGGSFSVGAMLLLVGGVLAIGHRPRRKRMKRG